MLACLARGNLLDILQEGFTEQQLQAYVAWVNSQLKKKPAIKPVQDLRQDLRDGVTLALLIEIVAGEKLNGIQANPTSQQQMRENVEKVLQFVASKKIRMHQTSAKDIVDGNLKSIMRLILALAAHFKPGSGRAMNHSAAGTVGKNLSASSAGHRPRSAAAVAQGAVAALADVRQDVLQSGRDVFRHRQRNSNMDEEIENPYWSVRALVQQYEGQQNMPLESHSSSLPSPTLSEASQRKGSALHSLCDSRRERELEIPRKRKPCTGLGSTACRLPTPHPSLEERESTACRRNLLSALRWHLQQVLGV